VRSLQHSIRCPPRCTHHQPNAQCRPSPCAPRDGDEPCAFGSPPKRQQGIRRQQVFVSQHTRGPGPLPLRLIPRAGYEQTPSHGGCGCGSHAIARAPAQQFCRGVLYTLPLPLACCHLAAPVIASGTLDPHAGQLRDVASAEGSRRRLPYGQGKDIATCRRTCDNSKAVPCTRLCRLNCHDTAAVGTVARSQAPAICRNISGSLTMPRNFACIRRGRWMRTP